MNEKLSVGALIFGICSLALSAALGYFLFTTSGTLTAERADTVILEADLDAAENEILDLELNQLDPTAAYCRGFAEGVAGLHWTATRVVMEQEDVDNEEERCNIVLADGYPLQWRGPLDR